MTIQIHYRSVLSRGRQPSKIRSEDMQKGARREEEKETKCMSGKSTKTKGVTKVAQRLLGPASFMLDGMPAILGALLEENDIDSRIRTRFQVQHPGAGMQATHKPTRSRNSNSNSVHHHGPHHKLALLPLDPILSLCILPLSHLKLHLRLVRLGRRGEVGRCIQHLVGNQCRPLHRNNNP